MEALSLQGAVGASCIRRGFILIQERTYFYSESNQSLEQPPQGRGGVPITGGLQDAMGQGAR